MGQIPIKDIFRAEASQWSDNCCRTKSKKVPFEAHSWKGHIRKDSAHIVGQKHPKAQFSGHPFIGAGQRGRSQCCMKIFAKTLVLGYWESVKWKNLDQNSTTDKFLKKISGFSLYSIKGVRCGNRRKIYSDRRIFKLFKNQQSRTDVHAPSWRSERVFRLFPEVGPYFFVVFLADRG